MKKISILFLLLTAYSFAQSIGNYRYVIIPTKFQAQKSEGQFGLNELTRQFLQKNGYTAYLNSEILPEDVTKDNCNKIYLDVLEDNSLLTTKLWVEIKDCTNRILFKSEIGESIEKDNRVANNQALRKAFKSFDRPEYHYNPTSSVPEKIEKKGELPQENIPPPAKPALPASDILSAQPIDNGFQLVDTTPKIVMKLFSTSDPEIFIGEENQAKGVVLKKDGQWFFEFYQANKLVVKKLNIKF